MEDHHLIAYEPISHNLVGVAAKAVVLAYPEVLASFCIVITVPRVEWSSGYCKY